MQSWFRAMTKEVEDVVSEGFGARRKRHCGTGGRIGQDVRTCTRPRE